MLFRIEWHYFLRKIKYKDIDFGEDFYGYNWDYLLSYGGNFIF